MFELLSFLIALITKYSAFSNINDTFFGLNGTCLSWIFLFCEKVSFLMESFKQKKNGFEKLNSISCNLKESHTYWLLSFSCEYFFTAYSA